MSDDAASARGAAIVFAIGLGMGIAAGGQCISRDRERLAISLDHARWEVNAKTGETVLVYLVP